MIARRSILSLALLLAVSAFTPSLHAQSSPSTTPISQSAPPSLGTVNADTPSQGDSDNMAAQLNASQTVKRSVRLKRTINGEVVETDRRTLIVPNDAPRRPSEASIGIVATAKQAFDDEVLTRTEALEEAKLDFAIADVNRDARLSEYEFSDLVAAWVESGARDVAPLSEEAIRQEKYDAFVAEINPAATRRAATERAAIKFRSLSGAASFLSRENYITEYLLEFDSMDSNADMLLRGEELARFRAGNRGDDLTF